ncbi:Nif3-like dinuclear metal center hexameric protein [Mucilaginibacter sp. X4EP1]|uniref:Nif3-like dinuclear metal center hexameric protein n=1 Tax=Mucilaginibacter sp. X4EP1 TaxID=2723092 RepID=UPI00216A2490|nr:Nif3-like dinuclear metal center hexameric protein [Mucilaginibacter sp. X4EP1]MCS3815637.1 putative NIF3 family GTP cyclohydrolase 1 type 2 [Mucilaginibacter sp. X4EP1]
MIQEEDITPHSDGVTRRRFIYNMSAAVGAGLVMASPVAGHAANFMKLNADYTVQQIIDLFIKDVPGGAIKDTIDTLKAGNPDMKVTGIVTTMFPTIPIIRNAADLGYNFIIAHEPTFYNHTDDTQWLQDDDVYQYKEMLLNDNKIAIWRNHDYIHHLVPDGVTAGVLAQLEWQKYADKTTPNVLTLQPSYLKEVITHLKVKLNIEKVRYIGDPNQVVKHALFIPGAAGGRMQIEAISKNKPDVLIVGEISEWETAEYVRDARAKGDRICLIVLGHIASEEPGSTFMLNWVKQKLPGMRVTHIPCGNSLSFM